ncbi:MAG: hypothetical protein HKN20_06915 [Gemmatimonadetes bacterium]|nr:hypothetical protein [Gemmatimonadota bacterium]
MKFRVSAAALILVGLVSAGCSQSSGPLSPTADKKPRADVVAVDRTVESACGQSARVRFLAGQHIEVGDVTVTNDENTLCVDLVTRDGWYMDESHVAIALTPEELPQTGAGNPQVGHFALSDRHEPGTQSVSYCIDLGDAGFAGAQDLVIAAHAVVHFEEEDDSNEKAVQEETAWGEGTEFPGNSWAMYFAYEKQDCGGEIQGE